MLSSGRRPGLGRRPIAGGRLSLHARSGLRIGRINFARLGLETPELARSLFGQSIQRLVLLDTGQDQYAPERPAGSAAHVDRPAATVWVGLGYLRLRLIGLVERLNRDAERQCAAALLI